MRAYELLYIVKPTLDDEAREAILNSIKEIITSANGEVGEVDVWGSRKLAYPIQKFRDGYYTLINFKATVDFPKELDRRLKISEDVMRHVIVAQEEK
ncbi:30S ribosomal protein S6 [Peptostreptococcus canis]|uniref:Small ribosomal subunit protein bS6 n=1 Tax=Peptostreptococcus canis TaxID=1159213 RepID=A0ABR6TN60_9FIRM|nr:30S ribosomal protein S6 [Peptostreptococcus canis]MBC2576854.1 30S ribosomal protein S6 [Peptostreptococcus canis]MBP1998925.1 small subunit ribosomal protein S6 [Peptostreptococcus canis]